MKANLLYFFISFLISISSITRAQDYKSKLIVSGVFTHYSRSGEFLDKPGFYKFPVDPGLEILYQCPLNESTSFISGISFQLVHFANYIQTQDRFRFGEISIPIIVRKNFPAKDKSKLYLSSGIYGGGVSFLDWERISKPDWKNVSEQYDEHYSSSDFFVDLYVDGGLLHILSSQNSISITPYFKYRIKENWMEYYKQSFTYGLKIGYQLNLIKK